MSSVFILFVMVTLLTIVSIVMWIVNGTTNLTKLENVISNVGRSYEEIGTCKDEKIKELLATVSDYECMRTELAAKITIIKHLETRICDNTRDNEQIHENFTKRGRDMDLLTRGIQLKDEEIAKYMTEIEQLENSIRSLQRSNVTMERKLDTVKKNLGT